ncbi:CPBP family glutamic-type intramembrane protease [Nonomuraea sp. NPDC050310]|uniref:CPBP family glutamic-type intramembrane protease n=1 Tax=Nonomuraea sp. NPDC050310 TaxID=3154935 RepID=UPI003405594A
MQEEPGWRGVALPHLQRRLHPLPAALLLGVVHCFWHALLFLIREWDTARSDPGQLLAYLVLTVSLSVVLSWLTNGSGGSLLLAILGHNSVNWALFAVATLTGHPVATTWPAALGLTLLAVVAARFLPGTASATSTDSRSETKQA